MTHHKPEHKEPKRFNVLTEFWYFMQNLAILIFILLLAVEMYMRFRTLAVVHPVPVVETVIVAVLTVVLTLMFPVLLIGFVAGEAKYLKEVRNKEGNE